MNGWGVFAIALFTSVTGSSGAVYVIHRFDLLVPKEQKVEQAMVPVVEGLPEADARANLSALGFVTLIGPREAHESAKAGTVVKQSLPAGQAVAKGATITINLAEAIPKLPSVIGKTVEQAEELLKELEVPLEVTAETPHEQLAKGLIISQTPEPGTPKAEGPLHVTVSAGVAEVEVPKVVGYTLNNAKTRLQEAGLDSQVQFVARAETPSYLVLQQEPKPGDKMKPGEKVKLVSSTGD